VAAAVVNFLDATPPRPGAVPTPRPISDTERVRAVLRAQPARWWSSRQIAARAGLTVAIVNGCVCALARRREITRALSVDAGRRGHGQRYRWTGTA
jgi:hypothetical protein